MADYKNIKYIIFDLGAVVLDIDYELTIKAFKNYGIKDFDNVYTQLKQDKLFDDFDRGDITSEQFRDRLRKLTNFNLSDQQIDNAWNALILDFDKQNIDLLNKIKANYFICLLSNTNAIHTPAYNVLLKPFGFSHISELFHKTYLSHEIGMRKPEEEIFKHVIKNSKLIPQQTLYIDDTAYYLPVAEKFGINTIHFSRNMKLRDLFDESGFIKDKK